MTETNLLAKVKKSEDVKKIDKSLLPALCVQIREKLVDAVAKNGGHLASNLGAVELTVALHRVFDAEKDKFVFDVGHQSYTHKLLTGRGDRFDTLRKKDGLSGFPKIAEGDAFGTGHSSTSVSAALGIATAMKKNGRSDYAIAVIGDGALTGGLAYEGLNNAGKSGTNLLVVLNENDMSISANVGAFSEYLSKKASEESYFRFKDSVKRVLKGVPLVGGGLYKVADGVKELSKNLVEMPERNLFEDLGFTYFGPLDGHDIAAMETVFRRVKRIPGPCLVHVRTVKGKGYSFAEKNSALYHGVGPFDKTLGVQPCQKKTYSSVFGETLEALAQKNEKLCAITAAMTDGVALSGFAEKYPDRFFDVGIAEAHGVTFAAGLAKEEMRPVFACYSSFLQRAYDSIVHDVELQKLPVIFAVDRAGLVGEDGDTHNGLLDVSMFSSFENTEIDSPASFRQLKSALEKAVENRKITVVRYPRGTEVKLPPDLMGDAPILTYGPEDARAAILTYGRLGAEAVAAKEILEEQGIPVKVVLLTRIKPINILKLKEKVGRASNVVFAEEGVLSGGIGRMLAVSFADRKYRILAAETPFVPQGTVEEQLKAVHLDAESLAEAVKENG